MAQEGIEPPTSATSADSTSELLSQSQLWSDRDTGIAVVITRSGKPYLLANDVVPPKYSGR